VQALGSLVSGGSVVGANWHEGTRHTTENERLCCNFHAKQLGLPKDLLVSTKIDNIDSQFLLTRPAAVCRILPRSLKLPPKPSNRMPLMPSVLRGRHCPTRIRKGSFVSPRRGKEQPSVRGSHDTEVD